MKNRNRGFTLLEVIISLALIGVISVATVSIFSAYLSVHNKAEKFNHNTALLFSALNTNRVEEGISQSTEALSLSLGNNGFGNYSVILKRKTIKISDGDEGGISYYEY